MLLLLSISCSNEDDTSEVNIRLANVSNVEFQDATYNGINYGDISPGDKTEYRAFEISYNYGSVTITIDGIDYGWIPIDFVGESPLENGNYTFEYDFDTDTNTLSDELKKD